MRNVLEMFEESALRYGTDKVFVEESGSLSWQCAMQDAKKIGSRLAAGGYKNRAVAILMPKCISMLVSFMGVIYSGNFYVPIDADMPIDRMKLIFDTIQPEIIVVTGKTSEYDLQQYNQKKVLYEELIQEHINQPLLENIRKTSIDTDPVYALFTSGSTGVPKGVIVCHRSVIDYAGWCVRTFEFTHETIFGNQTPFYFSMSVLDIYSTIASGGCLVIVPSLFFSFPADLVEFLNLHHVNTLYWVPSALCIIAKSNILKVEKIECIDKILFAGEVMPTRQLNVLRKYMPKVQYANLFGPTEITDIGIFYIVDREFEDDEAVPIGRPCDNVDAFVLDEDNNLIVEPDKIGELFFRGSYLAHGYYRNWEKTNEVFVQNPLNHDYPEIVYKTGDLVKWNGSGELLYVSRKDFQIKHMGCRVELGEIENCANAIKEVDRSAIVFDQKKDEIIMFFQGNGKERDVLAFMKTKLPKYMLPNRIIKVFQLPLNENGKIDKKKLQQQFTKSEEE